MSRSGAAATSAGWVSDIRDLLRLSSGTGLAAVLGFAFMIMAGRLLSAREFATLVAGAAVTYLASVATTSMAGAVAQLIAEGRTSGSGSDRLSDLCQAAVRRAVGWAGIVIGGSWLLSPFLAFLTGWNDQGAIVATAATVGAQLILAPIRGAQRGLHLLVALNRSLILEAVLRLVTGGALLMVWPTASAALVAYGLGALGAALAAFPGVTRTSGHGPKQQVPRLRKVAFGFVLVQAIVVGFHNLDMLIVRGVAPAADAALYGGGVSIARAIGFLGLPYALLLVPRTAAAEGGTLAPALRLAILFACFASPLVGLFLLAPKHVAVAVLGPGFEGSGPVLARLGLAFLVGGVNSLLAQALAVRRRYRILIPFAGSLIVLVVLLTSYRGPVEGFADRVLLAHLLALATLGLGSWWPQGPGKPSNSRIADAA